MKSKLSDNADANSAVESVIRGEKPRAGSRHGGRVMLSVAVLPEVRDALHAHADRTGVSMADYIANAIAQPERLYDTTALRQAKPLSDISYRLGRLIEALEAGDTASAETFERGDARR